MMEMKEEVLDKHMKSKIGVLGWPGGGKSRLSNLELYRIIVMLFIVAHHYVVNSGVMEVMEEAPMAAKSLYLYLLGMWGKTGIYCFVLITGYFMCKKQITLRKFLKLLLEVEFYNIVIGAAFLITGYESFTPKALEQMLVPIRGVASGFTSCFLIFYLLIPFLNVLVNHLDKRMHQRLLMVCLATYTVMGTVPKFHVTFNYVTWFCILYLISSYIRIHGICPRLRHSHWGWITLASVVIAMASCVGMIELREVLHIWLDPYWFVSDSNKLLAVLTSISSFMYFKDLRIKQSKLINTISASTFGVLCIHANSDTMRQWLWKDVVDCMGQYGCEHVYWLPVVSVVAIFAACVVLDYIRIHTIEKWILKKY